MRMLFSNPLLIMNKKMNDKGWRCLRRSKEEYNLGGVNRIFLPNPESRIPNPDMGHSV
jgi:hypothetical protein